MSGPADWSPDDLFADPEAAAADEVDAETESALASLSRRRVWAPGMDVEHDQHGRGWVWGAGRGVVTVRFETADTPPGRVLSLAADDPALRPVSPPPEP